MLQQNAVAPATLELLKTICAISELESFGLGGNAKKDYWDIAALLKKYSLDELLKIFTAKFPQVDVGFIIHSLTDFEKADTELDPDTHTDITWNGIKKELIIAVREYTERLL